jgi:DNA repair exonuclease SbcCD nuclease subunit
MRPFRLVHVADCHLDAPSRSLAAGVRARVDQSARTALERAVGLAVAERVDALVLAGDLFDRDLLRIPTEVWLPEILADATAAGVTVIAVTGNHDPGVANGPVDRIAWPGSGFQLVRSRVAARIPVRRPHGAIAGVVVAAGHEVAREHANLVAGFPADPAPGVPVVGLVHAQVHGYEGPHDRYAPCTVDDLRRAGYGYWALGHVHLRQQVLGDPVACYAGCLQGRHFGDAGAKGALLVEVTPDGAETQFWPLAPVRWELVDLGDLAPEGDMPSLVARIERRFEELQRQRDALPDQDWVLRLRLTGQTRLYAELRGAEAADDLALTLRERLQILDVEVRDDGLRPRVDPGVHRGAPHVLGSALDLIEAAGREETLLAQIAPERLAGAPSDPAARRAYVRSLLEDLDLDITAALLEEEPE